MAKIGMACYFLAILPKQASLIQKENIAKYLFEKPISLFSPHWYSSGYRLLCC